MVPHSQDEARLRVTEFPIEDVGIAIDFGLGRRLDAEHRDEIDDAEAVTLQLAHAPDAIPEFVTGRADEVGAFFVLGGAGALA